MDFDRIRSVIEDALSVSQADSAARHRWGRNKEGGRLFKAAATDCCPA